MHIILILGVVIRFLRRPIARMARRARTSITRGPRRAALAGFAVLLAGVVATSPIVRGVVWHRTGKRVSISAAVTGFRRQLRAVRVTTRQPAPAAGVYVYRTTGGEDADLPLGRERHRYPARTAVTILRVPCGFAEQWQPLTGRAWAHEHCASEDERFADARTFFNVDVERRFACDRPAWNRPTWRFACRAGGFTDLQASAVGRTFAPTHLSIGGVRVVAVRTTAQMRLRGGWSGRIAYDAWRRPDGLLLRLRYREQGRVSSHVGAIPYVDDYALDLMTLRPRT